MRKVVYNVFILFVFVTYYGFAKVGNKKMVGLSSKF